MESNYTLQECINAFNNHDKYMRPRFIRKMERLSEWRTAAKYWRMIGSEADAKSCDMLAEAIEKGDNFRSKVKHLHDWVETTVEQGIMTKDEAIKVIYPELSKIHNQLFV